MEIFHQLGELFLNAVPTVVIVLLFYVFMRWAFFTPILKAMAERRAHIEGARAEAESAAQAALSHAEEQRQAEREGAAARLDAAQGRIEEVTAERDGLEAERARLASLGRRVAVRPMPGAVTPTLETPAPFFAPLRR